MPGSRLTDDGAMNLTVEAGLNVTMEPVSVESQVSVTGDEQLRLEDEQSRVPSLSELLLHGSPQLQPGQAQYAGVGQAQLPPPGSDQPQDSSQPEPQEPRLIAQQVLPPGGPPPEQAAQSYLPDLGSLEAGQQAGTSRIVAAQAALDAGQTEASSPWSEDVHAQLDATQEESLPQSPYSQYPQLPDSQQPMAPSGVQPADAYRPQIQAIPSPSLDLAGEARTEQGAELPSGDRPEMPDQTIDSQTLQSVSQQLTDALPEVTTQPTNDYDEGTDAGTEKFGDSFDQWLEEFDKGQQDDGRESTYDDDQDRYNLSDDEYEGTYRDKDDDEDEDGYDENGYDEEGDEDDDEDDDDDYLNKGPAWGYKTNQAFLGTEYHDFDLHIGPMKETALRNFRHEPVRLRQFSETNMSLLVFYTWLGVLSLMLIIAFVVTKHRQKLVNLVWQRANYRRHRGSRAVEEGHTLLLQPNV